MSLKGSNRVITLFPAGADLLSFQQGAIGFLFELAPDSTLSNTYPQAVTLQTLIGDFEDTKIKAYELTKVMLHDEPRYRGIQQLAIFEELIIQELQKALHLMHLHNWIMTNGFTECRFIGDTPLASGLSSVRDVLRTDLSITTVASAHRSKHWSRFHRIWQRLFASRFTRQAFMREWWQILEHIDPYHRRDRIRGVCNSWHPNAIWFYTTAYTFTRIGLYYEQYFPKCFEYMVESPHTGGIALSATLRRTTSPYSFGTRSMEPSRDELQAARLGIVAHLTNLDLSRDGRVARQLLLECTFFQTFLSRHLRRGLFQCPLFEKWVTTTRPTALVVGNPVFEGYALHAARRSKVPTILLQHGILGDYCQFYDPPVDHYVVRGSFWRDFLAPLPRARAHVLEPPAQSVHAERNTNARKAILFLTTPYDIQEYWHLADLDDILRAVLATAVDERRELVIRVHPMEDIGYYQGKVTMLMQTDKRFVQVTYSQGYGLEEVLSRAAVAITYCSTVFLDCLRRRIPVVSIGWHDFSYKRQIAPLGAFHFANDLAGLSNLIKRALQGELPSYGRDESPFLAKIPEEALRAELVKLIQPFVNSQRKITL